MLVILLKEHRMIFGIIMAIISLYIGCWLVLLPFVIAIFVLIFCKKRENNMTKKVKDLLFSVFGISCKISFFVTSLVTAYCYNKTICFILISIFVLHNIITLWYFKGKKIKIDTGLLERDRI